MLLSPTDVKRIADRLLARSNGDHCTIKIEGSESENLRFARGNATTNGAALSVTHRSGSQASIGNHNGSTSGQDCTSCHYVGSGTARLTPPTAGLNGFGTGTITGN